MLILRCRIEKCGIGEGNIYQSSTKTENVVCVTKEQAQGSSLSDGDTQSMIINLLCILSNAFFTFGTLKLEMESECQSRFKLVIFG